eukprot:jgi/Tetstr1/447519/TSEL_034899.t1
MRVQLERARKEATLENTRRHLALVKRKHEEVSEALEIVAVHRLPARHASECVLKVPRTFSQCDKKHHRMIRGIGQWFDPVKGVHVPRTRSLFDVPFPQQSSNCAVREWRGYAMEELGVEHQLLEGKIVTAAVPIGTAVANRIWDLRWSSGYAPDSAQHPPMSMAPWTLLALISKGVKQTTGVTKMV